SLTCSSALSTLPRDRPPLSDCQRPGGRQGGDSAGLTGAAAAAGWLVAAAIDARRALGQAAQRVGRVPWIVTRYPCRRGGEEAQIPWCWATRVSQNPTDPRPPPRRHLDSRPL